MAGRTRPSSGRLTDLREIGRLRGCLVAVVEALEDGASDEAHRLAVAGLDEGLDPQTLGIPTPLRHRCADCGSSYRWPGELDHHRLFAHPDRYAEEEAA